MDELQIKTRTTLNEQKDVLISGYIVLDFGEHGERTLLFRITHPDSAERVTITVEYPKDERKCHVVGDVFIDALERATHDHDFSVSDAIVGYIVPGFVASVVFATLDALQNGAEDPIDAVWTIETTHRFATIASFCGISVEGYHVD